MRAFKAGDRVVFLTDQYAPTIPAGSLGTVTSVRESDGGLFVRADGDDPFQWFYPDHEVGRELAHVDTLPAAAPADDKALAWLKAEYVKSIDIHGRRIFIERMLDEVYGLRPEPTTTITFTPKG